MSNGDIYLRFAPQIHNSRRRIKPNFDCRVRLTESMQPWHQPGYSEGLGRCNGQRLLTSDCRTDKVEWLYRVFDRLKGAYQILVETGPGDRKAHFSIATLNERCLKLGLHKLELLANRTRRYI
jgi:hypothetical protein